MRKAFTIVLVGCFCVAVLFILYNNRDLVLTVETYSFTKTEKFMVTGFPEPIYTIYSPKDDFILSLLKKPFDPIEIGDTLIEFEKNQEEYLYKKAQSDYAKSMLTDGFAVQEEKKIALDMALKDYENTFLASPIKGFLLKTQVLENSFANKGSVLFQIMPENFNFFIPIEKTLEQAMKEVDSVLLTFSRLGISFYLSKIDWSSKNNLSCIVVEGKRFGKTIPAIEEILSIEFDSIFPEVFWIPTRFVQEGTVNLQNGEKKSVETIQEQDGLLLVHGLNTGQKIIGKR